VRVVGVVPALDSPGRAAELARVFASAADARVDVLHVADAAPDWMAMLGASSPWSAPYVDSRTGAALRARTDHGEVPPGAFVRRAEGCAKAAVVAFSHSVDLLVMDAARPHLVDAALKGARCPLVLVPRP